jgi:hypothetical protein
LEDAFNILKKKPSKEEIKRRVDAGLLAVNVTPSDIEGKYLLNFLVVKCNECCLHVFLHYVKSSYCR